ncbi:hypothetical protein QCA50_015248 [Cerrena zonata]|uniref:Uncharacterized protein n=1 Tax=Cerrena zonata TaxID=2478898 RepID=A0AAW0FLK4_9APHY
MAVLGSHWISSPPRTIRTFSLIHPAFDSSGTPVPELLQVFANLLYLKELALSHVKSGSYKDIYHTGIQLRHLDSLFLLGSPSFYFAFLHHVSSINCVRLLFIHENSDEGQIGEDMGLTPLPSILKIKWMSLKSPYSTPCPHSCLISLRGFENENPLFSRYEGDVFCFSVDLCINDPQQIHHDASTPLQGIAVEDVCAQINSSIVLLSPLLPLLTKRRITLDGRCHDSSSQRAAICQIFGNLPHVTTSHLTLESPYASYYGDVCFNNLLNVITLSDNEDEDNLLPRLEPFVIETMSKTYINLDLTLYTFFDNLLVALRK